MNNKTCWLKFSKLPVLKGITLFEILAGKVPQDDIKVDTVRSDLFSLNLEKTQSTRQ